MYRRQTNRRRSSSTRRVRPKRRRNGATRRANERLKNRECETAKNTEQVDAYKGDPKHKKWYYKKMKQMSALSIKFRKKRCEQKLREAHVIDNKISRLCYEIFKKTGHGDGDCWT